MFSLTSLRRRAQPSRLPSDRTVFVTAAVAALAVLAVYVNVLTESVDRGARLRSAGCMAAVAHADADPPRHCADWPGGGRPAAAPTAHAEGQRRRLAPMSAAALAGAFAGCCHGPEPCGVNAVIPILRGASS